jgi:hypothetical protein
MITDITQPRLTITDTINGIQITWQATKDWGRFANNAFSILLNLFVIGIIAYYIVTGSFDQLTSETATLVVLAVLTVYMLYRFYRRGREMIGAFLTHEVIQIDNQALTITRSGFMNIQREVAYPADRIQSIRSMASGYTRGLYPVFTLGGDALTRFRLGMDQVFCRGISESDAASTLARIHERFPRYQGIKA